MGYNAGVGRELDMTEQLSTQTQTYTHTNTHTHTHTLHNGLLEKVKPYLMLMYAR